jgi:hypothetical protein
MRVNISDIGSFTLILKVLRLATKKISQPLGFFHPGLIHGNRFGTIRSGEYSLEGVHRLYNDYEPGGGTFFSAPE